MKVIILSLLLFVFFQKSFCTTVSECTGLIAPKPDAEISNCSEEPCIFYLNETSTLKMMFNSPRYLENIAPVAVAYALGVNLTYPLGQDNACDGVTNTPCPLALGEYVEYSYSMFIQPIYPQIPFRLEFSLQDLDTEETVECMSVNLDLRKR